MQRQSQKPRAGRIAHHIRSRVLSGLFILVPLIATLFVLHLLFVFLSAFLMPVLGRTLPGWPQYGLRALAAAATLLIVYAVGVVAAMVVGRRLLKRVDDLFKRVPFVGTVYTASKQIVDTLRSGGGKTSFQAVVRVPFPSTNCQALAFVTGSRVLPDGGIEYRVFMPTTPNPTSGFLLILPASQVQFTSMTVEQGVKLIISGGVLGFPEDKGKAPLAPDETTGPVASGQSSVISHQ